MERVDEPFDAEAYLEATTFGAVGGNRRRFTTNFPFKPKNLVSSASFHEFFHRSTSRSRSRERDRSRDRDDKDRYWRTDR